MSALYRIHQLHYNRSDEFELKINGLEIKEHTILALVGANGSGKTTLLNLLSKQIPAPKEQLFFKDNDINRMKSANLAGIAYVHQSPYLFRGSVAKNLEIGLRLKGLGSSERKKSLEKYLDILNLRDLLLRDCKEISGGEAQRVAIGRMLVMNMQVLIFDEPFTYMDEKSCVELEELFIKLVKEKQCTIIFSTHDKYRAAAMSDKIIKLDNGQIVQADETNILYGEVNTQSNSFESQQLSIQIPHSVKKGKRIVIDARQIIISRELLDSSMQNSLAATVKKLESDKDEVKVFMDIGDGLMAIITPESKESMNLQPGDSIYASFKTSAVMVY